MNTKTLTALVFFIGYFIGSFSQIVGAGFTNEAKATVSGMSAWDLRNDPDFKRAVMSIAEEECKTDIDPRTFKTWFYCGGRQSTYAPR